MSKAPAPDAGPAMCPGIAVKGGGGGSGGGDGDGDGSGDGSGGDGKGNGKDGKGDGKGGDGSCAGGGKKKCTGCKNSPPAGDPVDIATGDVYINETVDFRLPGVFGLCWQRSYSSGEHKRDVGLGFGWMFSFGWQFEVKRSVIVVTDGGGTCMRFDPPQVGQNSECLGWVLERDDLGYTLFCGTDYLHLFRPLPADPNRYVLAVLLGPKGSELRIHYDDNGHIRDIVDSVGREVRISTTRTGRVSEVSVTDPRSNETIVFARYDYDRSGNLLSFTDADNYATRYRYDRHRRMVAQMLPSGLAFHYVYDGQGRCTESWGAYEDGRAEPALATDLPATLKDGETEAKGIYHVKLVYGPGSYREVVTETEIQRYYTDDSGARMDKAVGNGGVTTRVFDDDGNVVAQMDRNGGTTTYQWDDSGNLLVETDPLGHSMTVVRDEAGWVQQTIDQRGGVRKLMRDDDGFVVAVEDELGGVTRYIWDERGLMSQQIFPNGAAENYSTDAHGNLTEAVLRNGAVWRWRFDWWGRRVEAIDPAGHSQHYEYSPAGRLRAVRERNGASFTIVRDAMTNPVEITLPDGQVERYRWGGTHWLYEQVAPNGDSFRGYYNRDGELLAVRNEVGEMHRIEWSPTGAITRATTFDGRVELSGVDAMGNKLWEDPGHGRMTFQRDANGQVVEKAFVDGTTETFAFNPRRETVVAKGPHCIVERERNLLGQIVCERITAGGETTVVESGYTPDAERATLRTSLEHEQAIERTATGCPTSIFLDDTWTVRFERNAFDGVVRQSLPNGGVIDTHYDELARVAGRRVLLPEAAERLPPDASHSLTTVGESTAGITVEKRYVYSLNGELTAALSSRGRTDYEYDARDRLVARSSEDGAAEAFSYSASGDLAEPAGPARVYLPGGRCAARGGARYLYDKAGYLVRKDIPRDDGGDDVWSYQWSARSTLETVIRPDGTHVAMSYDPFRRRIEKRVSLRDEFEQLRLHRVTRYVYDEHRLLQERIVQLDDGGQEVSRQLRTYLYEETNSFAPLAQRVDRDGVRGEWVFFATDIIGTPEELVSAEGKLLGSVKRTAFGGVTTDGADTSVRFPGQFADADINLVYNSYRYYDPELGNYISPDPISIEGGLNLYAYCRNPIDECDPLGLDGHGLQFGVFDKNGAEVGPTKTSGSKVPGDKGKWNPLQSGNDGVPNSDPMWSNQKTGHTEKKALKLLDDNPKAGNAVKAGGTAKMSGQFPPCNVCHNAMQKWAKDNLNNGKGGKVQYHYPVNQTIDYTGKGAQGTKGGADKLINAYDNNKMVQNPSTGKLESTGSKEYQNQKTKAQQNPGKVSWP